MKEAFELIKERLTEVMSVEQQYRGKMLKEEEYIEANMSHHRIMGFNEALSIVSEVEAEYGNGWIDVKDRLPEKDGYYLTCDHKGNIHVFFHSPKYMEIDYAFGIGKNHSQYYQPIAWMELPKPYTGKKGA